MPEWSDEAKTATRRALEDAEVGLGDELALKHDDGRFGLIAVHDLLAGRLRVVWIGAQLPRRCSRTPTR